MSLPPTPPRYYGTDWEQFKAQTAPIKEGEQGWRVYALQVNLRGSGRLSLVVDGDFGQRTKRIFRDWQEKRGLTPDGVCGTRSQEVMLEQAADDVEVDGLPHGIIRGLNEAEGGHLIAPVNWYTPPGGAPGVDCGPSQLRQYGPPFKFDGLRVAFDARASYMVSAMAMRDRMKQYRQINSRLSSALLLRITILSHNWPAGALQVAQHGRLLSPDALATWTKKPGGGHYTRGEWLQVYPDKILKYVD